jgi:hypothetical protein
LKKHRVGHSLTLLLGVYLGIILKDRNWHQLVKYKCDVL